MRYWDASAVVPLCVGQDVTDTLRRWYEDDPQVTAWWNTSVECASALQRLYRESVLDDAALEWALKRLQVLRRLWYEVVPTEEVRRQALRALHFHPLRAADALQLAGAMVWAGRQPEGLVFVTADVRLGAAARREGFMVCNPLERPPC